VIDAWLDLLLGSSCAVCGAPGRAVCAACDRALPRVAAACWPTPTPPGLVRPSAVGPYAGALRALVLQHKEHGRLSLSRPLGRLLACAAEDAWKAAGTGLEPTFDLVPVPSHPGVVRARGQDPMLRVARCAAAALRRTGASVGVRPVLRVVRRPGDQAGLGAAERAANVRGRFALRAGAALPRPVVLVDDVVTTGATLREAQRAIEAGFPAPLGAAAVAATVRRHPDTAPRHSG
jgi:predicted amidophosphoribosyltransferase